MKRKSIAALLSAGALLLTGVHTLTAAAAEPWREHYAGLVEVYSQNSSKAYRYLLYDIDRDGTPELITATGTEERDYPYISTYLDGHSGNVGLCEGYGRFVCRPVKQIYTTTTAIDHGSIIMVYEIQNGQGVRTGYFHKKQVYYVASGTYGEYSYRVGDDKVTEAEFNRQLAEIGVRSDVPEFSVTYNDMFPADAEAKAVWGYINVGDPNGDNNINASDAAEILAKAAKFGANGGTVRLDDYRSMACDIDGNRAVNASDAALVLGYAAKTGSGWKGTLGDYLKAR